MYNYALTFSFCILYRIAMLITVSECYDTCGITFNTSLGSTVIIVRYVVHLGDWCSVFQICIHAYTQTDSIHRVTLSANLCTRLKTKKCCQCVFYNNYTSKHLYCYRHGCYILSNAWLYQMSAQLLSMTNLLPVVIIINIQ